MLYRPIFCHMAKGAEGVGAPPRSDDDDDRLLFRYDGLFVERSLLLPYPLPLLDIALAAEKEKSGSPNIRESIPRQLRLWRGWLEGSLRRRRFVLFTVPGQPVLSAGLFFPSLHNEKGLLE